jgi:CheY-like chemotaxis protein
VAVALEILKSNPGSSGELITFKDFVTCVGKDDIEQFRQYDVIILDVSMQTPCVI